MRRRDRCDRLRHRAGCLGGHRDLREHRRDHYASAGHPGRPGGHRVRQDRAHRGRRVRAAGASSLDWAWVRRARSVTPAASAGRLGARRGGWAPRPGPCPGSRRTGCCRVSGRRCAAGRLRERRGWPPDRCGQQARPVEGRPGGEPGSPCPDGAQARLAGCPERRQECWAPRSRWRNHRGRSSTRTPRVRPSPAWWQPAPASTRPGW